MPRLSDTTRAIASASRVLSAVEAEARRLPADPGAIRLWADAATLKEAEATEAGKALPLTSRLQHLTRPDDVLNPGVDPDAWHAAEERGKRLLAAE